MDHFFSVCQATVRNTFKVKVITTRNKCVSLMFCSLDPSENHSRCRKLEFSGVFCIALANTVDVGTSDVVRK